MSHEIFNNRKIRFDTLSDYGFQKQHNSYVFRRLIINGMFELNITITDDGKIFSSVIDCATLEPYILHLVSSATGAFVGKIRTEYQEIIDDFERKCLVTESFNNPNIQQTLQWIADKFGTPLEFLWKNSPQSAVMRRPDNKKWYIIFMATKKRSLGIDDDGKIEIFNIRTSAKLTEKTIDRQLFFPAYHMNKKSWITINPEAFDKIERVFPMIEQSYELAAKKS